MGMKLYEEGDIQNLANMIREKNGTSDTYTISEMDNAVEELNNFSGDYNDLTNKPTLGTASPKDVASSGDASATQVVMGNDSRLTDRRGSTWGQIDGTLANQTDLKNSIDSLQGQIDTFTALTDGSTTGDAELTNIRVDSIGHIYPTAGDAVRAIDSQVNDMKTGFDEVVYPSPAAMVQGCDTLLQNEIDNHAGGVVAIPLYRGSMNTNTGVITKAETTLNRLVSDITAKSVNTKFYIDGDNRSFYISYYDASKTFIKSVGWTTVNGDHAFENYPYFAFLIKNSDDSNFPDTDVLCYEQFYDVQEIKNDILDNSNNIEFLSEITTNKETAINGASRTTVSLVSLSSSKRWFFYEPIPAGSGITSIDAYIKDNASGIYLEVWEPDGTNLERVKQIELDLTDYTVGEVTNIPFNYYCENNSYIAIVGTTSDFGANTETANLMKMTSNNTVSTDEIAISSLDDFPGFWPRVTINYMVRKKDAESLIIVGPDEQFKQIQDAIDSITDDSASKPYTIIVMPNAVPYGRFSMIRKLTDPYSYDPVNPRYISVIGIDKTRCIVRSDTGNYYSPPAELTNNGIIKNLTFVMTHDNQDTTATQGGYCIHIDKRTINDVGYNMIIEDCDFENSSGPCLGVGMHKNCNLQIIRCRFNTTLLESYSPYSGYRNLYDFGCVFIHTSTLADATDQRVTLIDNVGECKDGPNSLIIAPAGNYDPSTASFYYTIIRNVFWNKSANAAGYNINNTLTADPKNFGNNNA